MNRLISFSLCLCVLLTGCTGTKPAEVPPATVDVLIDPGHGGFDGGAVAADGTEEKHINLSISLVLRDLLQVCGVSVIMTRETDQALSTNKSGDMQARLALYQQSKAVISVHQNQFSVPKYAGTQVFYSGNHSRSQTLARAVQLAVQSTLQPENHREIKKATDGIYLLHHATVPSVLVECGFLSNPEEREQLKSPDYQQKMAFAIAMGYWNEKTMK